VKEHCLLIARLRAEKTRRPVTPCLGPFIVRRYRLAVLLHVRWSRRICGSIGDVALNNGFGVARLIDSDVAVIVLANAGLEVSISTGLVFDFKSSLESFNEIKVGLGAGAGTQKIIGKQEYKQNAIVG
jgi:hypothetical protein